MGSGFPTAQLEPIQHALESAKRPAPPCDGPVPKGADTVWIETAVVCEVRYKEITEQGLLRQPVFVRFRDDKRPEECLGRGAGWGERGGGRNIATKRKGE